MFSVLAHHTETKMTIFTIGPLPRPLQGFRLFSGKSARRPRLLTSTKIKLFSRLFCAECRVWLITAVTGVLGELETSDKFSNEFAGVEIIFKIFTLACWSMKSAHGSTLSADMSKFNDYHSFPWYATLEKTKHPRKCFQNFRQSWVLSTDRIEIHQSQPLVWPSHLLCVMLSGLWLVNFDPICR